MDPKMQMSDTPITDKAQEAEEYGSIFIEVRAAWKLCRKLESELHAARESVNFALHRDEACRVLMARIEELKNEKPIS